MLVNQHAHLSPSLHKQYTSIVKFKVDFHRIYIQIRKDKKETWNPMPYLVIVDDFLAQIK